jgi:carboxyl-terminal processing protease
MKKYFLILIVLLSLILISCENLILGPDLDNTPVNNFDILWKEFDLYYPAFGVRQVNWDSLKSVYRNRITTNTDESQLWTIVVEMLKNFNDPHVYMYNKDGSNFFISCRNQYDHDGEFRLSLIKQKYLGGKFKISGEGRFTYARISGDSVGYLFIKDFEGSNNWIQDINTIVTELYDVKAMIIDLRDNRGGSFNNMRYIASAFINHEFTYIYEMARNGPKHDDFTNPGYFNITPLPNSLHYTKKIVLLTNNISTSASEHLAVIFKQLPYTMQIGDYTGGGFGSLTRSFQLPNGWYYNMPTSVAFLLDGHSPEGIGVEPDIRIINDPYRISDGYDDLFEYTLQYLSN